MATRWGIASTGKISNDFVSALNCLSKDEHKVVAVGSRSLETAQEFSKKYDIPKAYGSYEELGNDPDVDVVYVANVNAAHLPISKMMIARGKNVLCEKPLCMNVRETKELIEAARSAKVFLMEAIWSRCNPVYKHFAEELKKESIGEVLQVMASIGLPLRYMERSKLKEEGAGSVMHLGIYPIQLAQLVFGGEKPLSIQASGTLISHGIDEAVSATLKYSKNRMATINTHSRGCLQNEAFVLGTKGTIKILAPFWCPEAIQVNNETHRYPLPEMKLNYPNSAALMYEAMEVRRCLQNGLLESPLIPHEETVVIAEIMESIRKQVGVTYAQD